MRLGNLALDGVNDLSCMVSSSGLTIATSSSAPCARNHHKNQFEKFDRLNRASFLNCPVRCSPQRSPGPPSRPREPRINLRINVRQGHGGLTHLICHGNYLLRFLRDARFLRDTWVWEEMLYWLS